MSFFKRCFIDSEDELEDNIYLKTLNNKKNINNTILVNNNSNIIKVIDNLFKLYKNIIYKNYNLFFK